MSEKHILVIEDDDSLRDTMTDMLEMEGYTVSSAPNGRAGVELARAQRPDLVVCDIMMSGMSGHDVLAELKKDATTDTIPFIFVSARASATDVRQGMELGADDYLTKPFTRDGLMKAVATRLSRHAATDEHARTQLNELRASISMALPHEFRTPLQGLLEAAMVLKMRCESLTHDELRELAGIIGESAKRLDRLVRKYMLYTSVESLLRDPRQVEAARLNRTDSAQDAIAAAAGAVVERLGRATDLTVEGRDTSASIAEAHLQHIAGELVENACQSSTPGTPIRVFVDYDCRSVSFTVSDSGRGMTADQIASIGAFMQFDRRQHEQQGAGLGLAIVQRLVDLYEGAVSFHGDPSRGMTVRVQLPRWGGAPDPVFQGNGC